MRACVVDLTQLAKIPFYANASFASLNSIEGGNSSGGAELFTWVTKLNRY